MPVRAVATLWVCVASAAPAALEAGDFPAVADSAPLIFSAQSLMCAFISSEVTFSMSSSPSSFTSACDNSVSQRWP